LPSTILVTGSAGFIGYHVTTALLRRGETVLGLDNLNPYYDVSLKEARLARLVEQPRFTFIKTDLANRPSMQQVFADHDIGRVVHLAAQAGVRYSVDHPEVYVDSNLVGFANILEGARHRAVKHLVYASSSSVYGSNKKVPFATEDNVDHPISLYAATKKANELMAHAYSHLYRVPTTGLRFFTVYGPWGRPDMAMFLFTDAILNGRPINVFNHGNMRRDFTYIDDVTEGVLRTLDRPAEAVGDGAPYRVYNIGNHQPVQLMRLIELLEQKLGRKATLNMMPMQPGDVPETYAEVSALMRDVGFKPNTPIEVGVDRFVNWYREYFRV
jgi:UDP-glucuronate 4-epimerase